jgi:hypothetical protein
MVGFVELMIRRVEVSILPTSSIPDTREGSHSDQLNTSTTSTKAITNKIISGPGKFEKDAVISA